MGKVPKSFITITEEEILISINKEDIEYMLARLNTTEFRMFQIIAKKEDEGYKFVNFVKHKVDRKPEWGKQIEGEKNGRKSN